MQKGFAGIYVFIGILVLGAIGGAYYFGKSQTPKPQTQNPVISPVPKPATVPQLSSTPDETSNSDSIGADWKIYTNNDLSFKYPLKWIANGGVITSSSPKVRMAVVSKDGTLMNECMQEESEETKKGLVVKKFTSMTTGAMCSAFDPNSREIWVISSKDAFSPGISYQYSALESQQAEEIFNQILSTFKFTN